MRVGAVIGEEMCQLQRSEIWEPSASPQTTPPTGIPQLIFMVHQMNSHQSGNTASGVGAFGGREGTFRV